MIQIAPADHANGLGSGTEYQILIDGSVVFAPTSHVNFDTISIKDSDLNELVLSRRFSDLSAEIRSLLLMPPADHADFIQDIHISVGSELEITLFLGFDVTEWKKPWSVVEYFEIVERHLHDSDWLSWVRLDEDIDSFGIELKFLENNWDACIRDAIHPHIDFTQNIHAAVVVELQRHIRSGALVTYFEFPPEVRVACEQYLLYFTEFLRDAGINATAEIEHEAGQVLFSVKPADRKDALDAIREALDIYLRLPSIPSVDVDLREEIRIQQLAANIEHLKGQLRLAHAALQLQNATLEQQRLTIYEQRRLLSGDVVLHSLRGATSENQTEKEELLGGTLAITRYEGKGFEINLPEIVRRVRRLFSPDR